MTIHASSRFLVVCKHLITKNELYSYKARSNDVICDNKTLKSTLKKNKIATATHPIHDKPSYFHSDIQLSATKWSLPPQMMLISAIVQR